MAEIRWAGHDWYVRTWGGNPAVNGLWSEQNVSVDNRGYLRLRIGEDRSGAPTSAEINSQQVGWGYGTYRYVVGTSMWNLSPTSVFGMFTYGRDAAFGHREIDFEAASWGAQTRPSWQHTYYGDGTANVAGSKSTPKAATSVHELVWAPDLLLWRTYGADGMLLLESRATDNVPVPLDEVVCLNYWVFNGPNWECTPQSEVIVRDFRFTPLPRNPS